jgi:hypothetical protein
LLSSILLHDEYCKYFDNIIAFVFVLFFSAQNLFDLAERAKNPSIFLMAAYQSKLKQLNFTDEFIFDVWAAIDDVKHGRNSIEISQSTQL